MTYFATPGAFVSATTLSEVVNGFTGGHSFGWCRTKEKEVAQGKNFYMASLFITPQLLQFAHAITTLASPLLSRSLYIPLAVAAYGGALASFPAGMVFGVVKMGGYQQMKEVWNHTVRRWSTTRFPLSYVVKKLELPDALSPNLSLISDLYTEKLGGFIQTAVGISLVALFCTGKRFFAGAYLTGFALEKISHASFIPLKHRVKLERVIPNLTSVVAILTADIWNRVICSIQLATVLVPKYFYAIQTKIDQLIQKRWPLSTYTLGDLEKPNLYTRDLSFTVLEAGLVGRLPVKLDETHCSKQVTASHLVQDENFDQLLELFDTVDWTKHANVLRNRIIKDESFHLVLNDLFKIPVLDVLQGMSQYPLVRKKLELAAAFCNCFEEREGLFGWKSVVPSAELMLRRIESDSVEVLFKEENPLLATFYKENFEGLSLLFDLGRNTIREELVFALKIYQRMRDLDGTPVSGLPKDPKFLYNCLRDKTFLELVKPKFPGVEHVLLVPFEDVQRPFSTKIKQLAAQTGKSEEQFLAVWMRGQLKCFIDHLMGRTIAEGSAYDIQDAVTKMSFAIPCLRALKAESEDISGDKEVRRAKLSQFFDAYIAMAFDGGDKCARAMKEVGDTMLTLALAKEVDNTKPSDDSYLANQDLALKLSGKLARYQIVQRVFSDTVKINNDTTQAKATVALDPHNIDVYRLLNLGFNYLTPLEREGMGIAQYALWLYNSGVRDRMYAIYEQSLVETTRESIKDINIAQYIRKAINENSSLSGPQKNDLIDLLDALNEDLEPPYRANKGWRQRSYAKLMLLMNGMVKLVDPVQDAVFAIDKHPRLTPEQKQTWVALLKEFDLDNLQPSQESAAGEALKNGMTKAIKDDVKLDASKKALSLATIKNIYFPSLSKRTEPERRQLVSAQLIGFLNFWA